MMSFPTSPTSATNPPQIGRDQQYIQDLLSELSALRGRLKRRNFVIDAIRKAYLKDVVTVKHKILYQQEHPDYDASSDTELRDRVPSLDLRPTLELFAPSECSLRVRSCESCGGQLEVVHRESKRVASLQKSCLALQKIEQEVRLKASRFEIQANKDRSRYEILKAKSEEDRGVFLEQIGKLREQLSRVDVESFEQMKKDMKELESEFGMAIQKLGSFEELKKTFAETEKSRKEMEQRLQDGEVTLRELEQMRIQAIREKQLAEDMVKERDSEIASMTESLTTQSAANDNLQDELNRANGKNQRMQQLLDESRKNEAYLKQKISSIDAENREAMEGEAHAQEAINDKLEETRIEIRKCNKERDRLKKEHEDYVVKVTKEREAELEESVNKVKKQLTEKYESQVNTLIEDSKKQTEDFEKLTKKFSSEQLKRGETESKLNEEKKKKMDIVEQIGTLEQQLTEARTVIEELTEEVESKAHLKVEIEEEKKEEVPTMDDVVNEVNEENNVDKDELIRTQEETIKRLEEEVALLKIQLSKTNFQQHHEEMNEQARRKSVNGALVDVAMVAAPTEEDSILLQTQMSLLMDKLEHQKKEHDRHKADIEEAHRKEIEAHKKEIEHHMHAIDEHKTLYARSASELEEAKLKYNKHEDTMRDMRSEIQKQEMQLKLLSEEGQSGDSQRAVLEEMLEERDNSHKQEIESKVNELREEHAAVLKRQTTETELALAEKHREEVKAREETLRKEHAAEIELVEAKIADMEKALLEKQEQWKKEEEEEDAKEMGKAEDGEGGGGEGVAGDEKPAANEDRRPTNAQESISNFAQIELELDKIPKLENKVELLEKENTNLKSIIVEMSENIKAAEEAAAEEEAKKELEVQGEEVVEEKKEDAADEGQRRMTNAGNGAITMMLKAQIQTLQSENQMLKSKLEELDDITRERDEVKLNAAGLEEKIKACEASIVKLEEEKLEQNAGGNLMEIMEKTRLKKEKEEEKKQNMDQIKLLQTMVENYKRILMNLVSCNCDYVTMAEELLSKDAVDYEPPSHDEDVKYVDAVAGKLSSGTEIEQIDLHLYFEEEITAGLIVDYIDARNRAVMIATREEMGKLRHHRDNSTLNDKKNKAKGGAMDFMAKQREFKLNKKVEDLEKKMSVLKEESKKAIKDMGGRLEEALDKNGKMDEELKKLNSEATKLRPLVKIAKDQKETNIDIQQKLDKSKVFTGELTMELEKTRADAKVESAALFKANIKLKNNATDIDELEKANVKLRFEKKDLEKEKKGLQRELKDIIDAEKERLEEAEDVGLQFSPEMVDMDCQTDFVGKETSLRQSNSQSGMSLGKTRWAQPVVMATVSSGSGTGMGMGMTVASGLNTGSLMRGSIGNVSGMGMGMGVGVGVGVGGSLRRYANDTSNLPSIVSGMGGVNNRSIVRSANASIRPKMMKY